MIWLILAGLIIILIASNIYWYRILKRLRAKSISKIRKNVHAYYQMRRAHIDLQRRLNLAFQSVQEPFKLLYTNSIQQGIAHEISLGMPVMIDILLSHDLEEITTVIPKIWGELSRWEAANQPVTRRALFVLFVLHLLLCEQPELSIDQAIETILNMRRDIWLSQ